MASSRKSPCRDILKAGWDACAGDLLHPGQTVVVGLSGGLDSVALLHWLRRNIAGDTQQVSAVHVHHGLSPNADSWAVHCETVCAELGVALSVVTVNVDRSSKDGLEGAARRARHAAYLQSGGDWIVLGHHRRDQAETMLFNLLRGGGVRGAGAMRQRNGRLLRPWLDVGRDAIEHYAREEKLQWVEDESNADTRFSRNFLRQRILPALQERFPAAEARFAAAASQFSKAQELLDDLARIDLAEAVPAFPLPLPLLVKLSDDRAANVLAFLLRASGVAVPGRERLVEAVRQFVSAGVDRHPVVRFGEYHLCRRRGMIVLEATPNTSGVVIEGNERGEYS